MTITDAPTKFRTEGNGVTDTFAFSSKAFSAADLVVEIITRATDVLEETLTITTDYAVTILTNDTASIVTVPGKIPTVTQDIQIRRDLAKTQTTDLPVGTVFPAKLVENSIDRAVGIGQDLNEAVTRALKFPATSSTTVAVLPEPVDDAVIAFDGTTGLFKVGATNTSLIGVADSAQASADAAAVSETNAGVSETNAGVSETNAAASAAIFLATPVITLTSTSNAVTVDYSLGVVFSHIFTENTTFSFTNPSATSKLTRFEVWLTNDGTGRTPTWPPSVEWSNGVEPDVTTINEKNVIVFSSIDGGTTYYGALIQEALA